MLEQLRHRELPKTARDPSRAAAGMLVVPAPPRDPRRVPPEPARDPRAARSDISPASVVSIRVELRSRAQEPEAVRAVWRESESETDGAERARRVPTDTAAELQAHAALPSAEEEPAAVPLEPPPPQVFERAVAAYNFQRLQFDSLVPIGRPRLDVRA